MKVLSVKITFHGDYHDLKNNDNDMCKWDSIVMIRSQRNDYPTSDSVKITGQLNHNIKKLFKKYSTFITIDSKILHDKEYSPIVYNIHCKNVPVELREQLEKELLEICDLQLEKENDHKKTLIELL